MSADGKHWPHAPVHRLCSSGTFIVTAGTHLKEHRFRDEERRSFLQEKLLSLAQLYAWHIEAWAIFANHYHFVAHSPEDSASLRKFLGRLHTETAIHVNRLDGVTGRKVLHNFWDTRITYEKSYLARLNYVHQNAVKHGLVPVANQWPWCSAAWFERTAPPAMIETIYSFKTDAVNVFDDF
jgi:putative transposase